MTGRTLAIAGWLAWVVARPFRRTPLRRFRGAPAAAAAVVLLVLAALPIVLPQLDPQPADVAVDEIISGAVTEPGTWVRLTGRAYGLAEAPTGANRTPPTNSRRVRPREIRAINMPTKGDQEIHHPQ